MTTPHKGSNGGATAHRPLRVLIVEDSETDAFLLERALVRGGFNPVCHRVDTAATMNAALDRHEWNVILADHAMPQFSAPEALDLAKARGLDVPFIIVSGHIEEETAVAAMSAGAHDYIMKDRLGRLVPAVERELREAEVRRAQRRYQEELRQAHEELELRVEKRTADLRAANAQLQSMIEERRRLENELLEIAEQERRRIGFDLHDDLGQKLTGLSMMIKGLEQRLLHDQHPAAEDAATIRDLIGELVHHTHNLARQFSSLDLHGADVATALKGLAENVEKMFHLPCSLTVKGDLPSLQPNVTLQFYKIAQEAISNAIKHGHATRLTISVCRHPDKTVLSVRNDGTPFSPPANAKSRMGLRIMNYRANTIGALFDIRAHQKSGTVVTCTLPVQCPSPAVGPARPVEQPKRPAPDRRARRLRAQPTREPILQA